MSSFGKKSNGVIQVRDIIVVPKLYETLPGGNWYAYLFDELYNKFGFELRLY